MKNILDEAFEGFVAEGDEDYIGLWQIIPYINDALGVNIKKITPDQATQFWKTLSDFIARMLNNGFIAVNLASKGGCTPWPEQKPEQVMAKIKNLLVAQKGNLEEVQYGVWFQKVNKTPRVK